MGDRTDVLLFAPDEVCEATAGGVHMRGRLGLMARRGDRADAYLLGGTRLSDGRLTLSSEVGAYLGTIDSATRKADGDPVDSFLASAPLPIGMTLRGSWMIVTHGDGAFTRPHRR
ncbi:MAG: hypothetical protein ACYTG0_17360 [Planctomycetota bacterium]